WTAHPASRTTRAGATTVVALHAAIDEFFHLYSTTQPPGGPVRTTIALLDGQAWTLVGAPKAPKPQQIPDANFGMTTEVYDDSVTVEITLRAPGSLLNAPPPRVGIRYQTCTTRYC